MLAAWINLCPNQRTSVPFATPSIHSISISCGVFSIFYTRACLFLPLQSSTFAQFVLTASDGTSDTRYEKTIQIEDVNDVTPRFTQLRYQTHLPEVLAFCWQVWTGVIHTLIMYSHDKDSLAILLWNVIYIVSQVRCVFTISIYIKCD